MTRAAHEDRHIWYTPADCAAMLAATKHGGAWRAACPAHGGDNGSSLSIREGKDRDGNPMTLMHCHAQDCDIVDICAAMGIELRTLFAIHPDYAKATRNAPRSKSPRIDRLRSMEEPTPDEIAQILLEEMIVSDPVWIQECEPARQKMWELGKDHPGIRAAFLRALAQTTINPTRFWDQLTREREG
jgi:hypothetical protein